MKRIRILLAVGLAGLGLGPTEARALPPGYSIETVHPGLSNAVALRFAPDGRLFYLELSGKVMVYASASASLATVWALSHPSTMEGASLSAPTAFFT